MAAGHYGDYTKNASKRDDSELIELTLDLISSVEKEFKDTERYSNIKKYLEDRKKRLLELKNKK